MGQFISFQTNFFSPFYDIQGYIVSADKTGALRSLRFTYTYVVREFRMIPDVQLSELAAKAFSKAARIFA
jgi:hypothetical protein